MVADCLDNPRPLVLTLKRIEEFYNLIFAYDALGRRVKRTQGDSITEISYDGLDVVFEADEDYHFTKYTNALGIDNKLSYRQGVGDNYYFLQDHLGSTIRLTDSNGMIYDQIGYDGFGNPSNSFRTRFQYTGREFDAATGLYFYRARWYDAQIGRFISEDPIGFAGGDVNLFGYVGNHPIQYRDALGLQRCNPVVGAIIGGVAGAVVGGVAGSVIGGVGGAIGGCIVGAVGIGLAGGTVGGPPGAGIGGGVGCAAGAAIGAGIGVKAGVFVGSAVGAGAGAVTGYDYCNGTPAFPDQAESLPKANPQPYPNETDGPTCDVKPRPIPRINPDKRTQCFFTGKTSKGYCIYQCFGAFTRRLIIPPHLDGSCPSPLSF